MALISAINQDKPQTGYSTRAIMPRGTDNPPELVLGAKFHMINTITTKLTKKTRLNLRSLFLKWDSKLSGRRSRYLKKAHGKYSGTCPLPFYTFQVLGIITATNPFDKKKKTHQGKEKSKLKTPIKNWILV